MRTHIHSEIFDKTPEEVFAILITPSSICKWWGASRAIVIPEAGGLWVAAWGDEDQPDYISAFKIAEYDSPRSMKLVDAKYKASDGGLPFDAEFVTTFEVSEVEEGVELKVIQEGFPEDPIADDYYSACEKGWTDTFVGIRAFLDHV